MMVKLNTNSGRGTRLRAWDEQTLVPPERAIFQYSMIPSFHYFIRLYNPILSIKPTFTRDTIRANSSNTDPYLPQ